MDIVALVLRRLVHFHLNAMRVGPGVLTDAGHLPGDLHVRFVGFDDEAAIGDFRRDDGSRKLADHGELIPEVAVESFKPRGHRDGGCAAAVGERVAIVNVHHVGGFHEGMIEIFIGRIERMIDLEGAAALAEAAGNLHVAVEIAGEQAGRRGVYSVAVKQRSRPPICIDTVAANRVAAGPGASISVDPDSAGIIWTGASSARSINAYSAGTDLIKSGAMGTSAVARHSLATHGIIA